MDEQTRFSLADGASLLGLNPEVLWLRYAALGGGLGPAAFAAMVAGLGSAVPIEADLAAQTMNEEFLDLGLVTFPVGYERRRHGIALRRRSTVSTNRHAAAITRSRELQARSAVLLETSVRLRSNRRGATVG